MNVGAADSLRLGDDLVVRERRAQGEFELLFPRLTLQLLRALFRLALQVLNLPAHVDKLPLPLGILQPMLLGKPLLCICRDRRTLTIQLPRNGELQVFTLPFELAFAFAERQLHLPRGLELLRLRLKFVLQHAERKRRLPLSRTQRFIPRSLDLLIQLPVVILRTEASISALKARVSGIFFPQDGQEIDCSGMGGV